MLFIDTALIGSLVIGIPLCTWAISKDIQKEKKQKLEEALKEEAELLKMQIERDKLENKKNGTTEYKVDVKGMF